MTEQTTPTDRRIIRGAAVSKIDGLNRVTRWRKVRAGEYPAPLQLGPNSIGWYEDEVIAWVNTRPRVAYAPEPEGATV